MKLAGQSRICKCLKINVRLTLKFHFMINSRDMYIVSVYGACATTPVGSGKDATSKYYL